MTTVKVLLFAALREAAGAAEVELEIEASEPTAADVRAALDRRFPALAGIPAAPAIDLEYAEPSAPLGAAREIAFLPPVSGG